MRRKSILNTCLIICVLLSISCLTSCNTRKGLEKKIINNLEDYYNTEFVCESLSVYGGGADFVCYPTYDPTLLFNGFADSETGGISYDLFVGAIIAKEDTKIMTECLSENLRDVYVIGVPVHQTGSNAARVIRRGDYTIDDFRDCADCPNLFFYIFVDTSSESYIDDPGRDYDMFSEAVDSLVKYYKEEYEKAICADIYIYYVDKSAVDFSKDYFKTHVSVFFDFNKIVSPKYRIILQLGPEENGYLHNSSRLSRDEYIEERERIKEL